MRNGKSKTKQAKAQKEVHTLTLSKRQELKKREKRKSTKGETKEKRAIKPIRKPINETKTKN